MFSRLMILSFSFVFFGHLALLTYKFLDHDNSFVHGTKTTSIAVRLKTYDTPKDKAQLTPPLKKKVIKKKVKKAKSTIAKAKKENKTSDKKPKETNLSKSIDSIITNYVKPIYPRIALRRGITGEVVLALWVKGNGALEKLIVEKSSGNDSLDKSALIAAKTWKFKEFSSNFSKTFKFKKKIVYSLN